MDKDWDLPEGETYTKLNFEDEANLAEEEAHFFFTVESFSELLRKYGAEKVVVETMDNDVIDILRKYFESVS